MRSLDLVRHMAKTCGKSLRGLSVEMGRSPNWLSGTLSRNKEIHAETLSEIANACGYSLVISGHGETIEVDSGQYIVRRVFDSGETIEKQFFDDGTLATTFRLSDGSVVSVLEESGGYVTVLIEDSVNDTRRVVTIDPSGIENVVTTGPSYGDTTPGADSNQRPPE